MKEDEMEEKVVEEDLLMEVELEEDYHMGVLWSVFNNHIIIIITQNP